MVHKRGSPEKPDRNAEMVARYRQGESYRALAAEYGISPQRVWVIVQRERSRAG